MNPEISSLVESIRVDRVSGASAFVKRCNEVFQVAIKSTKSATVDQLRGELWEIGRGLIWSRPGFSSVINSVLFLLNELDNRVASNIQLDLLVDQITSFSEALMKEYAISTTETARNSSKLLKGVRSVLVHSYSNTVKEAFLIAEERPKVYCTESRPGFEGRRFASELSSFGCDCTVITEAAVAHHMNDVEMVLVGGDCLFGDGSIVNKMGTKMIAIIADQYEKPFYAACDSWKILSESARLLHVLEEGDSNEVLDSTVNGVKGRNVYFDVTKPELINGVATEFGLILPSEVSGYVRETGATALLLLSAMTELTPKGHRPDS